MFKIRATTTYTLDTGVLSEFNKAVQRQSRSATIERLIVDFLRRRGVTPSTYEEVTPSPGKRGSG